MKNGRRGLARGAGLDHGPTATNQGAHGRRPGRLLQMVAKVLVEGPSADRRAIIILNARRDPPRTGSDLAVVHDNHGTIIGEHDTVPILKEPRKIFDTAAITDPARRNDSSQKSRIYGGGRCNAGAQSQSTVRISPIN